jgi:hypothetical protein
MRQNINAKLLLLLFLMITVRGFSQTSLYVSSGTNLYITSGTYVYIDGLVVKPSVNYNITGENSVTRDATATPPPPTPYIQRVYHLLQTLPAYSGDITIYYLDTELNGLDENTLNLNVYNGSTWNAYTATARDAVNNFVTTTGLVGIAINEATLAAPDVVLPVTLTGFTAQNTRCVARLKWTTATEQNSKHFEVQHSTDGVTFTTIGVVPSSGNSSTPKHYSYNTNLSSQNNYFRLHMVDVDGSSKFSPVVSVNSNCNSNVIVVFPNPARSMITVNGLSGENHLRLLDAAGKVLRSTQSSNTSETINIGNLAAGTYILQIVQNNSVIENIKVIKE